ncbi:MAG: pilus assembly protein PilP [Sideroxydans sp.]|nr:pilus assembly protein PilP [Sideroxydans sp.]
MKSHYILIASLCLVGCGGEEFQDLRDFVKTAGADMRGKIPPAPEVKPYEPFVYENSTSIADPFKPRKPDLRSANKAGLNQPDLDRPKEALEDFPLEALKMVGYLQQKSVGYAVVKAPDNKIYRVKSGNYLGLNFGKVLEVAGNEVKIKEMVQDSAGDWTERMSTLQLVE